MSAALKLNFALMSDADWRHWLPIGEAAALLQCDCGHLARLCRVKLQPAGMAMFAKPPDGGQAQWFVRRSHDLRLTGGQIAQRQAFPDLRHYSAKQRDQALARVVCVEALREARLTWSGSIERIIGRLIPQLQQQFAGLPISRARLYAWDKLYLGPADTVKLIDTRGGDRRSQADPAAWASFKDKYCHQNQPSIRDCWEEVKREAGENDWRWCSYESACAQLDQRIPIEVQARNREPAKWRKRMQTYIAQDPERAAAGELWIGDHKQLDLIVRWRGTLIRPWLTTWMDWRTRRVVGHALSDSPNSTTILAALRHGLMDERNHGGPDEVWIDCGRDYDAWTFHGQTKKERQAKINPSIDEGRAHGIFFALEIKAHFSLPYNPNGKARLERWFGDLGAFCKTFHSYTGNSTDTKPERLNDEVLKNPHLIPTFEHVADRLVAFIEGNNQRADHSIDDLIDEAGQRLSPDQAMARCDRKRAMADPAALDLLLAQWHKPVPVGRNGITLHLRGRAIHYGQFEPALTPYKAMRKSDRRPLNVAFDPHDIASVRVFDEQFRYVCEAKMNAVGGADTSTKIGLEHVAEHSRQKARYEKSLKHVAAHGLINVLTTEEQIAEIAAQQRRQPAERREQQTLKLVQTPLDGEAKHVRREQLRQAVGAETASMALPSPSELMSRVKPRPRSAAEPFIHPLSQLRERQA